VRLYLYKEVKEVATNHGESNVQSVEWVPLCSFDEVELMLKDSGGKEHEFKLDWEQVTNLMELLAYKVNIMNKKDGTFPKVAVDLNFRDR